MPRRWLLYDGIFHAHGINLGFFNALVLTSWTVIALFSVSSLTKPVGKSRPGAPARRRSHLIAGGQLSEPRFHAPSSRLGHQDPRPDLHVGLQPSDAGRAQAILLAIQDRHLRQRRPRASSTPCPLSNHLESMLFEMIGTGLPC